MTGTITTSDGRLVQMKRPVKGPKILLPFPVKMKPSKTIMIISDPNHQSLNHNHNVNLPLHDGTTLVAPAKEITTPKVVHNVKSTHQSKQPTSINIMVCPAPCIGRCAGNCPQECCQAQAQAQQGNHSIVLCERPCIDRCSKSCPSACCSVTPDQVTAAQNSATHSVSYYGQQTPATSPQPAAAAAPAVAPQAPCQGNAPCHSSAAQQPYGSQQPGQQAAANQGVVISQGRVIIHANGQVQAAKKHLTPAKGTRLKIQIVTPRSGLKRKGISELTAVKKHVLSRNRIHKKHRFRKAKQHHTHLGRKKSTGFEKLSTQMAELKTNIPRPTKKSKLPGHGGSKNTSNGLTNSKSLSHKLGNAVRSGSIHKDEHGLLKGRKAKGRKIKGHAVRHHRMRRSCECQTVCKKSSITSPDEDGCQTKCTGCPEVDSRYRKDSLYRGEDSYVANEENLIDTVTDNVDDEEELVDYVNDDDDDENDSVNGNKKSEPARPPGYKEHHKNRGQKSPASGKGQESKGQGKAKVSQSKVKDQGSKTVKGNSKKTRTETGTKKRVISQPEFESVMTDNAMDDEEEIEDVPTNESEGEALVGDEEEKVEFVDDDDKDGRAEEETTEVSGKKKEESVKKKGGKKAKGKTKKRTKTKTVTTEDQNGNVEIVESEVSDTNDKVDDERIAEGERVLKKAENKANSKDTVGKNDYVDDAFKVDSNEGEEKVEEIDGDEVDSETKGTEFSGKDSANEVKKIDDSEDKSKEKGVKDKNAKSDNLKNVDGEHSKTATAASSKEAEKQRKEGLKEESSHEAKVTTNKDFSADSIKETNSESSKESAKESKQDLSTDSNKEKSAESIKETTKESKQEVDKDFSSESDTEKAKEAKHESNKDFSAESDKESSSEANEKPIKEMNQESNKVFSAESSKESSAELNNTPNKESSEDPSKGSHQESKESEASRELKKESEDKASKESENETAKEVDKDSSKESEKVESKNDLKSDETLKAASNAEKESDKSETEKEILKPAAEQNTPQTLNTDLVKISDSASKDNDKSTSEQDPEITLASTNNESSKETESGSKEPESKVKPVSVVSDNKSKVKSDETQEKTETLAINVEQPVNLDSQSEAKLTKASESKEHANAVESANATESVKTVQSTESSQLTVSKSLFNEKSEQQLSESNDSLKESKQEKSLQGLAKPEESEVRDAKLKSNEESLSNVNPNAAISSKAGESMFSAASENPGLAAGQEKAMESSTEAKSKEKHAPEEKDSEKSFAEIGESDSNQRSEKGGKNDAHAGESRNPQKTIQNVYADIGSSNSADDYGYLKKFASKHGDNGDGDKAKEVVGEANRNEESFKANRTLKTDDGSSGSDLPESESKSNLVTDRPTSILENFKNQGTMSDTGFFMDAQSSNEPKKAAVSDSVSRNKAEGEGEKGGDVSKAADAEGLKNDEANQPLKVVGEATNMETTDRPSDENKETETQFAKPTQLSSLSDFKKQAANEPVAIDMKPTSPITLNEFKTKEKEPDEISFHETVGEDEDKEDREHLAGFKDSGPSVKIEQSQVVTNDSDISDDKNTVDSTKEESGTNNEVKNALKAKGSSDDKNTVDSAKAANETESDENVKNNSDGKKAIESTKEGNEAKSEDNDASHTKVAIVNDKKRNSTQAALNAESEKLHELKSGSGSDNEKTMLSKDEEKAAGSGDGVSATLTEKADSKGTESVSDKSAKGAAAEKDGRKDSKASKGSSRGHKTSEEAYKELGSVGSGGSNEDTPEKSNFTPVNVYSDVDSKGDLVALEKDDPSGSIMTMTVDQDADGKDNYEEDANTVESSVGSVQTPEAKHAMQSSSYETGDSELESASDKEFTEGRGSEIDSAIGEQMSNAWNHPVYSNNAGKEEDEGLSEEKEATVTYDNGPNQDEMSLDTLGKILDDLDKSVDSIRMRNGTTETRHMINSSVVEKGEEENAKGQSEGDKEKKHAKTDGKGNSLAGEEKKNGKKVGSKNSKEKKKKLAKPERKTGKMDKGKGKDGFSEGKKTSHSKHAKAKAKLSKKGTKKSPAVDSTGAKDGKAARETAKNLSKGNNETANNQMAADNKGNNAVIVNASITNNVKIVNITNPNSTKSVLNNTSGNVNNANKGNKEDKESKENVESKESNQNQVAEASETENGENTKSAFTVHEDEKESEVATGEADDELESENGGDQAVEVVEPDDVLLFTKDADSRKDDWFEKVIKHPRKQQAFKKPRKHGLSDIVLGNRYNDVSDDDNAMVNRFLNDDDENDVSEQDYGNDPYTHDEIKKAKENFASQVAGQDETLSSVQLNDINKAIVGDDDAQFDTGSKHLETNLFDLPDERDDVASQVKESSKDTMNRIAQTLKAENILDEENSFPDDAVNHAFFNHKHKISEFDDIDRSNNVDRISSDSVDLALKKSSGTNILESTGKSAVEKLEDTPDSVIEVVTNADQKSVMPGDQKSGNGSTAKSIAQAEKESIGQEDASFDGGDEFIDPFPKYLRAETAKARHQVAPAHKKVEAAAKKEGDQKASEKKTAKASLLQKVIMNAKKASKSSQNGHDEALSNAVHPNEGNEKLQENAKDAEEITKNFQKDQGKELVISDDKDANKEAEKQVEAPTEKEKSSVDTKKAEEKPSEDPSKASHESTDKNMDTKDKVKDSDEAEKDAIKSSSQELKKNGSKLSKLVQKALKSNNSEPKGKVERTKSLNDSLSLIDEMETQIDKELAKDNTPIVDEQDSPGSGKTASEVAPTPSHSDATALEDTTAAMLGDTGASERGSDSAEGGSLMATKIGFGATPTNPITLKSLMPEYGADSPGIDASAVVPDKKPKNSFPSPEDVERKQKSLVLKDMNAKDHYARLRQAKALLQMQKVEADNAVDSVKDIQSKSMSDILKNSMARQSAFVKKIADQYEKDYYTPRPADDEAGDDNTRTLTQADNTEAALVPMNDDETPDADARIAAPEPSPEEDDTHSIIAQKDGITEVGQDSSDGSEDDEQARNEIDQPEDNDSDNDDDIDDDDDARIREMTENNEKITDDDENDDGDDDDESDSNENSDEDDEED